jgi:PAS domain S-box-containing protein
MTTREDANWQLQLFDRNPIPMLVVDRGSLEFLDANDAAVHRYGYTRDEFRRLKVTDIRPAADVPAALARIANKPEGVDHLGIWRHQKKNGEIFHVEIVSHELVYEGRKADLVVVHDVSDRVQAAETLRKHVAILEAVGFAASQLLGSAEWGQSIPEILARLGTAADVSRAYLFTVDSVLPDDIVFSQCFEWAAAHASAELSNETMQKMSFRDNGFSDWLPILRSGLPVFGAVESFSPGAHEFLASQDIRTVLVVPIFVEGSLWGFVGFDECRESRHWTDAEVEALRTAAHIIGMGVQRSVLEKQFLQSQKMEVVGFLASGIAHDFNNALAVVFASCDFLGLRLAPEDPALEDVREIRRAAERGAALTRQLLSFSRDQRLSPRDLDVNETIENVSSMIKRLLGENIEVVLELSPRAGAVHMDPNQLEQVLINLAVNARDAMPSGGVLRIRTSCAPQNGDHSCNDAVPDGTTVISVSDTGSGMPREVMERAFEPFFTTKPAGKGTGLGLAMAQRALFTAGGSLDVTSEVGVGTTMSLRLPRRGAHPTAASAPLERAGRGHRETILVVEDDDALRKVMVRILSEANYKPIDVANGDEALARLEQLEAEVRLVVTDVLMPGMSGVELARRAKARLPGLKVLLCSGHADETLDVAGFEGESLRLLRKPFGSELLLERIADLLAE